MIRARKPEKPAAAPEGQDADGGLEAARALLKSPGLSPSVHRPLSLGTALRATAAIVAAASFGLTGLAIGDPLNLNIASRADIDIRVGRNANSGRIEIYGTVGSRASVRRESDPKGGAKGGMVVIRMPGSLKPDLGDIRSNPPIGITSVDLKSDARATELWIKVADGYDTHFGREDGAVFVQIDPQAHAEAAPAPGANTPISINLQQLLGGRDEKAAEKASQSPAAEAKVVLPVIKPEVVGAESGGRDLTFTFPGPVAAAVFRRGESVWIVFDREVDLRLPAELKDGQVVQDAQWTHNDGFTALRLKAPSAGSLSAQSDGLVWRVRLGGRSLDNKAVAVSVVRDDSSGAPSLNLNLAGATRIAWIRDPSVGDRMAVATARGPVKNLITARTMLEATLVSTAQGVVVAHMTPDVKVAIDGDLIEVTRPDGLTLSPIDPNAKPDDSRLEYKNALYPSLTNTDWAARPEEGFLARYSALQVVAADEAQLGPNAGTKGRLALARYLVGQGMAYEAQGVLDMLTRQSPRALDDPQVRGLRVAARMLTGRYADATADLSSPQLAADPAARLWQAYAETKNGHYPDAVKDFKAGLKAMDQFPVEWRTRLGAAYAYAAMQTKDLKTADKMITYAVNQEAPPLEKLAAYLIDAQIIEAMGDKVRALNVFEAVAKASDDRIAAPAMMRAAMLRFALNRATAPETIATLDGLRFRWRGDGTELQIISSMGQIYLSQGRYREALQVLTTAGKQFGDQPQAVEIQTSLSQAFRNLFLGGMADGLQPVEALGLFNDFRSLTPIGTDGDEMVRKIVRRLVDVDLLDQAADLLQYQIENRLQGVAKSSVAADLASIYLMDRNPQKALQALWNTRTTLLSKSVMAERRVLEARALSELGQPDKALDALGNDSSPDGDDVRADIYWQQQDWAKASAILERRLGDRYKTDKPLTLADEGRLIRTAVAMSLLKDDKGLARMSERWGKFAATASSPDALRVALAPLDGGSLSAKDFASAAAATDSFAGWVSGMKKRFREKDDAAAKAIAAAGAAKSA